jgi:phytoene dehydrogenase-like protein
MAAKPAYDAIIIGAGPTGLAAAIALAQAGRRVLVREGCSTVGGGTRTAELTLPGFRHDVCSSIHPLSLTSPYFRTLPLKQHGLEWIYSPAAAAHPLDGGTAVVVQSSVRDTSETLGADGRAYRTLLQPLVDRWLDMAEDLLGPFPLPPKHVLPLTRFGLTGIWPVEALARGAFSGTRARAVLAGMAGHSMLPFNAWLTAAIGLIIIASGHAVGWPMARGGSQAIADALADHLRSLGGEIVCGQPVTTLEELPSARHYLFNTSPGSMVRIAGSRLPSSYASRLGRYRHGPGVFKMDWALDGPIPWAAAECAQAATVHLGGTFEEIAASEKSVWLGQSAERPYILLAQNSLFDDTRAPAGSHTVWAYCHVPNGSTFDMTERIEAQIERFAPGFRDRILARSTRGPADMERYNPNYVGGDINNGVQDWRQFWTRPVLRAVPYSTPNPSIYLCSSATPPGGGVHGMCGYHAARAILRADR